MSRTAKHECRTHAFDITALICTGLHSATGDSEVCACAPRSWPWRCLHLVGAKRGCHCGISTIDSCAGGSSGVSVVVGVAAAAVAVAAALVMVAAAAAVLK